MHLYGVYDHIDVQKKTQSVSLENDIDLVGRAGLDCHLSVQKLQRATSTSRPLTREKLTRWL